MRFLIVSLGYHPEVLGGAWRVAAEQAAGLAARGHEVDVVTAHPGGGLAATEERRGVRLARYPQRDGFFLANWRAENRAAAMLIRERLREDTRPRPLIIQHHAYLEPAVATAPARVLHVYHGPWAEEYRYARQARPRGRLRRAFDACVIRIMHRVERRALRRADRILVLSRHFADQLPRWHGARFRGAEVVGGGVDFESFHPDPDRAAVRAASGLAPDAFLCVAVRRLDPRMGLDLVVDAFSRLTRDHPNARLWMTGHGPAEGALREQIAHLNLGSVVRLLGVLPEADLPRLLNAADVALMPSIGLEGFGLATAEALACGTPVLGSRAGATPELLEGLSPDLLFEPGSSAAIEARLRVALGNPGTLPARAACADYARRRFSWENQVLACERLGGELLGSARG